MSSGLTLHVKNEYGANTHHIVESCFKALAYALRQAIEIDREWRAVYRLQKALGGSL